MTDSGVYSFTNNSGTFITTVKSAQAQSLVRSAVSFVLEDKFDSAAGCFEALLILVHAEQDKFNYSPEYLLALKFALCCCYFYAGTEQERNLQLLKEIEKFDDHIPALHYITAAILYKLNIPALAMKSIERGLCKLSKCTLTKLYFWPETDILIHLTEKKFLNKQLDELKAKLQTSIPYISSPSSENKFKSDNMVLASVKSSKLNVGASEFFPVSESVKPNIPLQLDKLNPIFKQELDKHYDVLQKVQREQIKCNELKMKLDSQQTLYEKKLNELESKLEDKDQLIVTLSTKNRLTQETIDNLLSSIKSLISEQNNNDLEKVKTENIKLKNIVAQLIEKYFSIQFALSKSNEVHCMTTLENLSTLLRNQDVCSDFNASKIEEEISVWKAKLDSVQKHRRAAENTLMLMKSNISDDSLKLLNELSEGCSCVANKPDLVHEICLRKVMKNTDNSNLSTINDGTSDGGVKDWKYHLRKHRGTSLGLNGSDSDTSKSDTTEKSTEATPKQNKRVSFVVENSIYSQECWIDQEVSKLSERVKLIGGPNYWRLIVFIKNKLPLENENTIVDAVEMVRASYGKLNGLSRDTIYSQAKGIIQARKGMKDVKLNSDNRSDSSHCSICLEQFDINTCGILTCGHRFHKSCIQSWLGKEPLCPVCKAFIVPQEYNTLKSIR